MPQIINKFSLCQDILNNSQHLNYQDKPFKVSFMFRVSWQENCFSLKGCMRSKATMIAKPCKHSSLYESFVVIPDGREGSKKCLRHQQDSSATTICIQLSYLRTTGILSLVRLPISPPRHSFVSKGEYQIKPPIKKV